MRSAKELSPNPTRRSILLTVLLSCACLAASAQDTSGQALGDIARKTRQEHSTANHVPSKKLTDEDDGPDGEGVWRIRLCTLQPCYEFAITLPRDPKWSRAEQEPRPVLIPIAGHEDEPSHSIRVYEAQSTDLKYTADTFKRAFLQGWFARPEYFGRAARIALDEHVRIDWTNGLITHFEITAGTLKYRGVSAVAGSPYGNFGFACVYREEDSAAAGSICDAIVHSAQYQELQSSAVRKTYKDPNDPDPPEDEDP